VEKKKKKGKRGEWKGEKEESCVGGGENRGAREREEASKGGGESCHAGGEWGKRSGGRKIGGK
jgi:hypothetical protein